MPPAFLSLKWASAWRNSTIPTALSESSRFVDECPHVEHLETPGDPVNFKSAGDARLDQGEKEQMKAKKGT